MDKSNVNQIPNIDEWVAEPEDIIFTNSKNIIIAPIAEFFHQDPTNPDTQKLNYFIVKTKKSYNSEDLRNHNNHYLNYFEKYYDPEKELFTNMANIKFLIDAYAGRPPVDAEGKPQQVYTYQNFIFDLHKYILQPSIYQKVIALTERNYSLSLSYKSMNNPQLQYTDEHAKALQEASILMNICIPLICHFAYTCMIADIDEYLLTIYDSILNAPIFENKVRIFSKLFETAISNVEKNKKNNEPIWNKQDIRGITPTIHAENSVKNIILNIMPKYTFDKSMISLNYTSIQKNNRFQITDIAYEYTFIPLSSSKRDGEDNASDFDRYEANMIKTSEALYLQSKVNCRLTTQKIETIYGELRDKEVNYFMKQLKNDNDEIVNGFQKQLIFNLFYKYYGDTESIKDNNARSYVKLMLIGKKMLQSYNMRFLPYVLSSKVNKVVARKTLNKKELTELQSFSEYQMVVDKYKNEKIIKQILGTIATIITSDFNIIDYDNQNIDGKRLVIEPSILMKECLIYALLI
jgi:hypothetical protein